MSEGLDPISLGRFLTSSSFAVDVMENWQSEYLQFFLYIFATVWLVQHGSAESKKLEEVGPESDEKQRVGAPRQGRLAGVGEGRGLADGACSPARSAC